MTRLWYIQQQSIGRVFSIHILNVRKERIELGRHSDAMYLLNKTGFLI